MAYRKKTIRKMLPVTRKLARMVGEVSSLERRLKTLILEVKEIERKSTEYDKENDAVLDRITE